MRKKINLALVGSNFALRGYLPVIEDNNNLNLKILCSRNVKKIKLANKYKKLELENDWKKIFKRSIDLIVLAVPPKVQEKILKFNLKYKKMIILEKPISTNYLKSKKLIDLFKKKKIKAEINLTFLNHPNFIYLRKIIKNKKFGKVLNYYINWNFVSYDYNVKKKSWKVQQKLGGGITNIFLTHVLSYCEFLFGKNLIYNINTSTDHFKKINFIKKIKCEVKNPNNVNGNIILQFKKTGNQNHLFKINFKKCSAIIENKSKDWTKNFRMKINNKLIKFKKSNKYNDGRCDQIESLINQFLRRKNYKKINYCLNSEKIINQIKY